MSAGAAGGAGAAAAAAAIANAIKASGVLVRVESEDFVNLLLLEERPLVVVATGRWWSGYRHRHLAGLRGLAFVADTDAPIPLPNHVDVIEADKIWIPG